MREELNRRQENHRLRLQGLEEEWEALKAANEELRRELERLKTAVSERENEEAALRRTVEEELARAHLEQSGIVWEAMERLRQLDEELERRKAEKQHRRGELLEQFERRLRELMRGVARGGNEDDQADGQPEASLVRPASEGDGTVSPQAGGDAER